MQLTQGIEKYVEFRAFSFSKKPVLLRSLETTTPMLTFSLHMGRLSEVLSFSDTGRLEEDWSWLLQEQKLDETKCGANQSVIAVHKEH